MSVVMRGAPITVHGARVARIMRLVRCVGVSPMAPIMMRLRLRPGQAKGRDRNQGHRRRPSKPAYSRATVTQRHETPHRLRATVRPKRRSQLRYAHGRERYAGAVTQRLTGFRRAAAIFAQAFEISIGPRARRVERVKLTLSKCRLLIEIIYCFSFCPRFPFCLAL